MRRIILVLILISTFGLSAFSQSESKVSSPIIDPDRFGKMSWADEKTRLSNFADRLNTNEDKIGVIMLQFAKNVTRNQIKVRLNRINSYLIGTKKIEKSRFKITISKNEFEETMYWTINKSEFPEN